MLSWYATDLVQYLMTRQVPALQMIAKPSSHSFHQRTCQNNNCQWSTNAKNLSHYHCTLCDFTIHGFNKKKMKAHAKSKHETNQYLDTNKAKGNKNEISNSAAPAISSAANPTLSEFEVTEEHCYSASHSPPFSVVSKNSQFNIDDQEFSSSRSSVVKKSKISTPSSANPEHTLLAQLPISPLLRKEISGPVQSDSARCQI